nr:hypothetical protein [Gemmatimonadaceae bacterium]
YFGSQYVHRTVDEGATWERISPDLTANDPRYRATIPGDPITIDVTGEELYATLYAIRESPIAPGVIWTGANDGPIHVTRDNGRTWTDVTPAGLPPGGRVQSIEPSPHRAGSAYVAVLRYLLGDFQPYLYKTDDYGRTWRRLTSGSNGIPADEPTRVVREDPSRAGLLYAGTEFGMYLSFDDGAHWRPFQLNLPAVPVTDITIRRQDLVLSTQGRSFWIFDDLTPLQQMTEAVAARSAHLFTPRSAIRYRYRAGFGGIEGERDAAADAPVYPAAGAMIDYWLSAPASAVSLEILDDRGTVVRSFTSDSSRDTTTTAAATTRLSARIGVNRFIWDMKLAGPWTADSLRGRNGPLATPGAYRVRFTAGDMTETQPLLLLADPRVARDGISSATLGEQLAYNLRVRDLVSDANRAVVSLKAARARLGPTDEIVALERALVTPAVRYSRPGLQAHIAYLYGMTNGADQRIGRDAVERYAELRQALDALLPRVAGVGGP